MKQSEKTKLCGSTSDLAETIIDYKKGKTEIKGVPHDTVANRIKSAWIEYATHMFIPFFILGIIAVAIAKFGFSYEIKLDWMVWAFISIITALSSLHVSRKLDYKVKKAFALKTGAKKRNRLRASEFKSREFILYDIKNIAVDYEANGDVSKKLSKIWIKEEHPSSMINNQGKIEDLLLLENKPIWNVHFIFEGIPKSGSLYVEWI